MGDVDDTLDSLFLPKKSKKDEYGRNLEFK